MNKLFWETVTENMRLVLDGFSQTEIGARFYLAGGTALSLQIGHRRTSQESNPLLQVDCSPALPKEHTALPLAPLRGL